MKQGILKQFMCMVLVMVMAIGLVPMEAFARTEISVVEVGCNPPVAGRKAEFEAWANTEGVQVYKGGESLANVYNSVSWYDETAEEYLQEDDLWTEDHVYTIWVYLFIQNFNYIFKTTTGSVSSTEIPDVDTMINGTPAAIRMNGNHQPTESYIAKYTFSPCEEAPADITQVGVTNLSYPVAGQLVDYDVDLVGEGYKFCWGTEDHYTNGLLWYDATANQYVTKGEHYKSDHEYWLIIPIIINQPYRFAVNDEGDTAVTVTGVADEMEVRNGFEPGEPRKRLEIYYIFDDPIEPIRNIELKGITAPVEGQNPDYFVSTVDAQRYDVINGGYNPITWYEDERIMNPTDTYQAGYTYKVAIEVCAQNGNIFAVDDNWDSTVTGVLDGNDAVVVGAWEESATDVIELRYEFGACEETTTKNIEIDGVEQPIPGNVPSDYVKVNTPHCSIDTIRWYKIDGNEEILMESDDYFRAGYDYKVRLSLNAENGKPFYSQMQATVNGNHGTFVEAQSDESVCVIDYTFQWEPVTVSEVSVSEIDMPVPGKNPDYSATVGNNWLYKLAPYGWESSGIWWFDSENVPLTNEDFFEAGKTYKLEIKLVPATDNPKQVPASKFVTPVAATINGEAPTDVAADSSKVYLYHEFECEKCETCTGTWEIEKKATETENGKKTRICTVCGETEDAVIYAASGVKLSTASYTYDGGQKSPSVKIYDSKGKAIDSTNYTVTTPSGRTKAGTYSYKVTFKNEYTGTKSLTLTIKPAAIGSTSLSKENYTYDGKSKKPTVTVKNSSGKKLVNDTDYTVTYGTGRTKIGKYKVTVKGKGNYSGSKVLYFEIGPKDPSSVKTTLYGHDDVKVSWSKVSGVTGYKVYYKKASASSYTLLKTTTETSLKKSGLSDGVKYDFKVVAYKKVSGNDCENAGETSSIYTLKKISGVKAVKSSSKVKTSWTNISGETGYQISQSTSKTKTNIVSTYKTTSGTSKTISATKGKTYYYKVRAYKEVDGKKIYGPWSDVKAYKR